METLNKAQQKYLRKTSHHHKPLFQMGKLGLTDAFIDQVEDALEKRELIKFHLLQNTDEDLREVTRTVADKVGAYVLQVIGSTAILYRPSSKQKFQEISREVTRLR